MKVEIAVVGGGIVGCSILYALARRGCRDAILLERGELASGSTWHAAGNVTHFGHYAELTRLYVESLDLYREAEQVGGQDISFRRSGSLRLATDRRELNAYRKLAGLYHNMKVGYDVIGPEDISRLHPLIMTDGICGAAHTPDDGHVDPSAAVQALARAARMNGAVIRRNCNVLTIRRTGCHGWEIETTGETVECRQLVLAASFWSRSLAEQVGLDLPLFAVEHHEIITDRVPELAAMSGQVPTIRDPWAPANVRQEQDGLLCGVYESAPVVLSAAELPAGPGLDLLESDLDRLDVHLDRVARRIPAFGRCGFKRIINGLLCFTPDGCPIIGPATGLPGLWLAAGFPVGIGTGGGAGNYLAGMIIEGKPPYAMPLVNPARFSRRATDAECIRQIKRVYAAGYRPVQPPLSG